MEMLNLFHTTRNHIRCDRTRKRKQTRKKKGGGDFNITTKRKS